MVFIQGTQDGTQNLIYGALVASNGRKDRATTDHYRPIVWDGTKRRKIKASPPLSLGRWRRHTASKNRRKSAGSVGRVELSAVLFCALPPAPRSQPLIDAHYGVPFERWLGGSLESIEAIVICFRISHTVPMVSWNGGKVFPFFGFISLVWRHDFSFVCVRFISGVNRFALVDDRALIRSICYGISA